jgi:hypothetical protein
MIISNWKPFVKNTLRGFFTVTLPSGLIIHKCSLHEKNGSRWVGLPAEKYTAKNGNATYSVLLGFTSADIADSFRDAVLEALDRSKVA